MKASDWANFIWYSLLVLTFVIAVIWIILDSRKHKGRLKGWIKKVGNWFVIIFSRIWTDIKRIFVPPSRKRLRELEEKKKAERYRQEVLLRYVCPRCERRLIFIPAVPQVDGAEGNKYFCANCGYERVEKKEEIVAAAEDKRGGPGGRKGE